MDREPPDGLGILLPKNRFFAFLSCADFCQKEAMRIVPFVAVVATVLASALPVRPAAAQNVCLPGTFSETGKPPCLPCPPGTAQPRGSQTTCVACRPSTYADTTGRTACLPCPDGSRQLRRGGTTCEPEPAACPPGSFSADGHMPCTLCPPGRAQARSGSTVCLDCPDGMIAPNEGQASCRLDADEPQEHDAAIVALAPIAPGAPTTADPAAVAGEPPADQEPATEESPARADTDDRPVADNPEVADAEDAETTEAAVVASAEPAPRCAPGSYSLTGFTPCLPCPDGVDCSAVGTSLQALRAPREGARF